MPEPKNFIDLHPGSDLAIAAGCRCDKIANALGCGRAHAWGVSFIIKLSCPIHGDYERNHFHGNAKPQHSHLSA